jgi:hypothetical protein
MRALVASARWGRGRWRATQSGVAGIVLLAILVMGSLYGVLVAMNTATAELQRKRDETTAAALRRAKEALIAYAITYSDTHPGEVIGYLPCPDDGTQAEGQAALNCGAARVSQLGRLPWRTLALGPLRDSDGQCLWYAVSGTYKYNPKSNLMNWDTPGQFNVVGPDGVTLLTTPANRAVAVIIAPGAARGPQVRVSDPLKPVCGGDYANAAGYLDADAAAGVDNAVVSAAPDDVTPFIAGNAAGPGGNLTDRVVFITAEEVWTAAKKRADLEARLKALTQKVAECLAQAANTNAASLDLHLPWPARLNISASGAPFYYALNNFDDRPVGATLRAGRVPYVMDSSTLGAGVNDLFDLPCMNTASLPYFPTATAPQNWFENWKDHFLYVIADEFKSTSPPTIACGPTCLTVNGTGLYAGIVLFAGQKGPGQSRDTEANKDLVTNYLEAPNQASFSARYADTTGPAPFNYQRLAGGTFPEVAFCIAPNGPLQSAFECP